MASTTIRPATLVSNIKNCIPIQLDEEGVHYNTWSTLFQVHCSAHLVLDHIIPDDSSKEPETSTSEWKRLDDIVRTWIYSTICPALLTSIVQPKDSARDVWDCLEKTFYNNKTTRTIHLEAQFPNVKSYCNELKKIATTLKNLGTTITDNRLALQVLQGLTFEYRTFRSLVQHMNPVPSFDNLRSMLELEEHSHKKDNSPSQDSALVQTPSSYEKVENFGYRPPSTSCGGRRAPPRGGRTNRQHHQAFRQYGRGYGQQHPSFSPSNGGYGYPRHPSFSPRPPGPHHYSPNQSWASGNQWAQPPCPHPTTSWSPNFKQPNTNSDQGILGPRPAQGYCTESSSTMGYCPTDIDQAMHTLFLTSPDEQYYMDTGATSHITKSQGIGHRENNSEV